MYTLPSTKKMDEIKYERLAVIVLETPINIYDNEQQQEVSVMNIAVKCTMLRFLQNNISTEQHYGMKEKYSSK